MTKNFVSDALRKGLNKRPGKAMLAALFAVCGSGIYWYAGALKNIPTYAYHGDNDTIVPIYESINMVKAINKWGGNAKIKIAYNYDHDINDLAYSDPEIYNWLLEQHQ